MSVTTSLSFLIYGVIGVCFAVHHNFLMIFSGHLTRNHECVDVMKCCVVILCLSELYIEARGVFPYAQISVREALFSRKKKGRKTPKRTGPLGRTCSRAIVY